MSEVVIIHELMIFDKRCVYFMNELYIIRFRALKISSTAKKKNKRSSRRSLKTKIKYLLRHYARVDFDSNREHRQKTFAAARSIEKNSKFIIDSDSN